MTWLYNNKIVDEDILTNYIGFVYCITNNLNKRKYIGKKLLKFKRTKTIKGKKKSILIDSDWKTYYGSNKELIKDVLETNKKHFTRVILLLCKTKSICSYYEGKLQMYFDCILTDAYYNSWVQLKVSDRHLRLLDDDIMKEYNNIIEKGL